MLGAEWHPDFQVGEDMLRTKSCLGGSWYPRGGPPQAPQPPSPSATWAKLCPDAAARRCPCRGAAAAGKFAGPAAGTARLGGAQGRARGCPGSSGYATRDAAGDARGARGTLARIHRECCSGCSEDAAQDAREVLAGMLGRCSVGTRRDDTCGARGMLGGCSGGCSRGCSRGCSSDVREVLPGMTPGIFGGCWRGARRQARGVLPGLLGG